MDGRDADVTISGRGLVLDAVQDVIITNPQFTDFDDPEHKGCTENYDPEDAISLRGGSHDIWIDHSDFSNACDKAVGSSGRCHRRDRLLELEPFLQPEAGDPVRPRLDP